MSIRSTSWSALFNRVKTIPHDDPELTPENWCQKQPCTTLRIASKKIIISQPSSTFWVYLLGFLAIGAGLYFFHIQNNEISRFWWGVCLLLWGIGALLAGTSYQVFGYHIKCAGRKIIAWTSWWELVYLIFQQVSMNALLAAVAYSCTTGSFQKILLGYGLISSIVYVLVVIIGGMMPMKSLITFEFMVWFSAPVLLICVPLNFIRFYYYNEMMDLVLLFTWVSLFFTIAAYWVYFKRGISKKLWQKGIWFSENDLLHVLLILWMAYIAAVVANRIKDYSLMPV